MSREDLGRTATHWLRSRRAYGPLPSPLVVDVWWPLERVQPTPGEPAPEPEPEQVPG